MLNQRHLRQKKQQKIHVNSHMINALFPLSDPRSRIRKNKAMYKAEFAKTLLQDYEETMEAIRNGTAEIYNSAEELFAAWKIEMNAEQT